MFKKFICTSAISIVLLTGSVFADNGRGIHVGGTTGTSDNSTSGTGTNGSDVLLGGAGDDFLPIARAMLVAGVKYLIRIG